MICHKCGQTIDDTATFCRFCGSSQKTGWEENPSEFTAAPSLEEEVLNYNPAIQEEPAPEPLEEPVPQPRETPVYQEAPPAHNPYQPVYQPAYQQPVYQNPYQPQGYAPAYAALNNRPRLQLPTCRGLAKMFFLSILTLGIYGSVIWSRIVTELNIVASPYDGKRTVPYQGMIGLSTITLGIYSFVWSHGFCKRIGQELKRRNINYKFGASTFWLWNILGSFILVGPFIYIHKLMKAMNLLNADFNERG